LCCASALLLVLIAVQALVDVAAQGGCLASALAVMELVQSLVQVRNSDENAMLFLSLWTVV
jgi:deoxyxylulose-5-phosphate synthase